MEIGVHVAQFDDDPAALRTGLARVGEAAEEAGITWLSVMDHFFQLEMLGGAEHTMLEGYSTLTYLAGQTSTVRLGLLVGGVTYRHPGLLAKTVTTLDVLAGGRTTFGIGAAWYEREHHGLGVEFPPLAERFERLEETLQITHQMWDPDNNGPYDGKHFQLAETLCLPRPISSPRPETMIGGTGEKKTLRLVAEYADACNFNDTRTPEAVAHKLDVLRGHCERVGRDPSQIRVTMLAIDQLGDAAAREEFVESMRPYAALGVDQVILVPPGNETAAWIERNVAPLVPRLAELST